MDNIHSSVSSHQAAMILSTFKEDILDTWTSKILENYSSAFDENSIPLKKDLPYFIDSLADALESKSFRNVDYIEGSREFSSMLNLDEIVREYSVLRKTVLETLQNNDVLFWESSVIINAMIDQALEEDIKKFQDLKEKLLPQIVWMTNEQGELTYINKCWETFSGRSLEQEKGWGWSNSIHPEDKESTLAEFQNSLKTGKEFRKQFRFLNDKNEYRWLQSRAEPLRSHSGSIVKWLGNNTDIHEQKELENYQQRLLEVIESSSDFISFEDSSGKTIYINEAGKKLLGIGNKTQLITMFDLIEEKDKNFFKEEVLPQTLEHNLWKGEVRLRHYQKGHPLLMDFKIFLTFDSKTGRRTGYAIVARNLTEERKVEAAFRSDKELSKAILNNVMPNIWTADANGKIDFLNHRWFKFIGINKKKYSSESWENFIHPDDKPRAKKQWLHSIRTGENFEIEYRFKNAATGRYNWFLGQAVAIRSQAGQIIKWVGSNTDITKQKARERQLTQLAETSLLLNSTVSLSEKFNILVEHARNIIEAHQSVISITVDHNWAQSINAVSLSKKYADWEKYQGRTEGLGIYSYVCKNNKPLRLTQEELEKHPVWGKLGAFLESHPPLRGWLAVPLVSSAGKNFGMIQLSDKFEGDFTESDEAILVQLSQIASASIENSNLLIREKEAVRARDEFLTIASHELKTPLTSLKLQSQIIKKGIEKGDPDAYSPPKLDKLLTQTEKQVTRLSGLVEDMLDISKIRTGKFGIEKEDVDLCKIVRNVIRNMEVLFSNAGVNEPVVEYCQESHGYWDRGRIEQVINILLSNAIRYGRKGTIKVRIENLNEKIRLYVKDEGIGIAKENQRKIFERFERAISANEISGLGLGLFISKQIIKAHGGDIWVESEVGRGSEFIVELPKYDTPIDESTIHGV